MTYTFVVMDVSPATHAEILQKLRAARYDHLIDKDGTIDMHGIALRIQSEPEPTPHADSKVRAHTRAGRPL